MIKSRLLSYAAVLALASAPGLTASASAAPKSPTAYAASQDAPNGTAAAASGLNVRHCQGCRDGVPSTALPTIYTLGNGTKLWIRCYYHGETVSGPWGSSDIWDVVPEFQEPGQPVASFSPYGGNPPVVSDAWVYTGSMTPVVPHC